MASQIKWLVKIFSGSTLLQIRKIAYEFAENIKVKQNFVETLEIAGINLLNRFHPAKQFGCQKSRRLSNISLRMYAFCKSNKIGMLSLSPYSPHTESNAWMHIIIVHFKLPWNRNAIFSLR